MARGTGLQYQVKSYQRRKKVYVIHSYLTLSIIKYVSWLKRNNPDKRAALLLNLGVVAIKKNFLVTLDYGQQIYLYIMSVLVITISLRGFVAS